MNYRICNIKGFEKLYLIYADGRIYSVRKKRFLKFADNGSDNYHYLYVCLIGHNKQQLRTGVHRIVAHHFLGPQPDDHISLGRYEVNHIDGNSANNHYTNLEWITHVENIKKAVLINGKWQQGRTKGYTHKQSTKQLISEAHKIPVLLSNDTLTVNCLSIQDAADYLKVSRRTIERKKNSYATIKGFKVSTLT